MAIREEAPTKLTEPKHRHLSVFVSLVSLIIWVILGDVSGESSETDVAGSLSFKILISNFDGIY